MSDVKKEKKAISVESIPFRLREQLKRKEREAAEPMVNAVATSEAERLLEWFRAYRYGLYDIIPDKKDAYHFLQQYINLSVNGGNSRKNVLQNLHNNFVSGTDKLQSDPEDALYIQKQLDEIYNVEFENRLGCLAIILIAVAIWYFWPSSDKKQEVPEPPSAVDQQQKKDEKPSTQQQSASPKIQETKPMSGTQQDNASVSSDLALGGISIGDSTDKIFQRFGNPVKQENRSGGKICYFYPSVEVHCLNGKAVTLVSNSPHAKTPKGIGEGSPVADVLTAYGANYMQFRYGGDDIYEYEMTANNGTPMLFRFAIKNGVVDYISIRRKTASESTSATQNVQTQSQSKTSSSVTDQMTEAPRFAAIKVFRAFHLSISDHKLRKAYDYFSEDMKNYMSYDGWAPGFNATVRSVPLDIQVAEESPDRVVLTYVLEAVDSPGGTHHFNGTTVLIKTNQGWKIDDIINKAR